LKNISIIHVLVAFENVTDINRLLSAISSQNEKSATIICVDNSIINSDEIFHLCQRFSMENNANIYYLKNLTNEGSSTGFALGMQKAYILGADWIWLHDQDSYPKDECLNVLLKLKNTEGILAPFVVAENNNRLKTFAAKIDKKNNLLPVEVDSDETEIDLAGTAGLFISRKVIDKIGVYDFKHYFVGLEDFDYCLRARNNGFNIKIITDAIYFHPDKWNREDWEINNGIKFFGNNDNNRIQNGSIYFNIFFSKHLFLLSLGYSIFRIIIKYLLGKNINLKETIKAYFYSTLGRVKKKWKYEINLNNRIWIEL
jgi:GT2 family glycosyltransferase